MKYTVRIRKYETVIREAVVQVEASGKRLAEQKAIAEVTLKEELLDPPSPNGPFDVKYEVVRTDHSEVKP